MKKTIILCSQNTVDLTPCLNPVTYGSHSCAAGHPIPLSRWNSLNQMVSTEHVPYDAGVPPTISSDYISLSTFPEGRFSVCENCDWTGSSSECRGAFGGCPVCGDEDVYYVEIDKDSALQIATQAHLGQFDKSGAPYIDHPRRVADRMAEYYGDDSDEYIVAILHDTVEDTHLTLKDLRKSGCSLEQIEAINALTHRKDETNIDYLERVKSNLIALRVKFGDIEDNTDEERMASLDEETQERLRAKYQKALEQLTS